MSPVPARSPSAISKVLVVEDEPGLRFIISDVLVNDHGLTVLEAGSGDQALRILNEETDIGCVFTDVRMPGAVDGIALTRRLRRDFPEIQVVVTSGHLAPQDVIEDVPFISKPYNLELVAALIEELVHALGPRRPFPQN